MSLPPSFEPGSLESKWYRHWLQHGMFKPAGDGDPYCVLLPPPNVTGTLHMGHAFQQTIMDALVRHARMSGKRALWQGGTDHAGIATQKIVENRLAAEGKTRHDLGREDFVDRVWEWKRHSGSTITNQMQRLGASIDWSRERFTMDEGLSAAVRKVFVEWARAGLIYRGKRLVHWDPVLRTAVSDLEVNSEERDGFLWSILYPFGEGHLQGPGGTRGLVVATTRPETLLGDVAVAVHPEDERYAHLVGKTLTVPLVERRIPIIADASVDRAFGTGCVKITPAHDFNDYATGQRHGLPLINVLTLDARIISPSDASDGDMKRGPGYCGGSQILPDGDDHPHSAASALEQIPETYRGLDRYEAREAILADLEARGLLVGTSPHKLQVPVSQRSDAVIEPMLTDQWFVDLTREKQPDGRPGGLAAITRPALEAVTSGAIRFVPENWSATYVQWLEHIQDWCISRQLWWGHRIPAWYTPDGDILVGEDAKEALDYELERLRREIGRCTTNSPHEPGFVAGLEDKLARITRYIDHPGALVQDEDVLDTWFSSALWPFSTMGWPKLDGPVKDDQGEVLADWRVDQAFLPSAALVTGFDIIFFWVARMVMATRYFTGKVPFREVYINAIVRDAEGQKMSKSKGNTIDPLDLIDGIDLEELVHKSTASLLIPQVRAKVEKRIRKEYPDGIKAVGTDALRFTFAALATHGRTINFDLKRADGYRNFCNKLWNAARFVLMNTEGFSASGDPPLATAGEKWIHARFRHTMHGVAENFASYRFDLVAHELYQFVWNDYCDWFLELSKLSLNGGQEVESRSTRHTLLYVLEGVLRALHPIMPFITEEIWQQIAPRLGLDIVSVLGRPYPSGAPGNDYPAEARDVEVLIGMAGQIRSLRSQLGVSPGKRVPLLVEGVPSDPGVLLRIEPMLQALCRLESVQHLAPGQLPPPSAASPVLGVVVHVPLAGLINLDAERARLTKERRRVEAEIGKCEKKLASPTFVANAPTAVVAQERERLVQWRDELAKLDAQAVRLG